ncbi:MAG: hypothetical protein A2Y61_05615 [Chloroflexi bacterium RBG_13_60_13]|nr:MAG: hypothetical protein A2Y61_05615 [Chloroflexi bacterium RBG_13_60_13]
MTAGATPTKNDPKPLASGQLATSVGTLYTAPAGERGCRLTGILLVNDTTTNVTVTLYHVASGASPGDNNIICKALTVPADGAAILVPGSDRMILTASQTIQGLASAATQATYHLYGIEMAA